MTVGELDPIVCGVREAQEAEAYLANYRAGLIAATIANVNRKKEHRALKPKDFIGSPPWEKKPGTA